MQFCVRLFIIIQVVVDDNLMVISAQTGWPGCAHDARVLRNSDLFDKAETGVYIPQDRHLLGDFAYPLKQWLITPFRDNVHLTDREKTFNKIVSSCRQTVERAIGHIKGRFRRLREVTFHSIKDRCEIVMAGCRLHNQHFPETGTVFIIQLTNKQLKFYYAPSCQLGL